VTGRAASVGLGLRIGRQLAHPSGWAGQVLAIAMRVANRLPNRAILAAVDARPGQTVLDVGCGDGTLIARLPPTVKTIGIDGSDAMIAAARRRNVKTVGTGWCRLIVGDMLDLALDNRSVDRVIASNVLYFCTDIPRLIEECRRVARPGAILVVYVTAEATMRKWRFASARTHRHFSAAALMAELLQSGVDPADIDLRHLRLPANVDGLLAVVQLSRVH
jgi:ubiquinone/menaquinone biosynthesis C-methylase UbiE